jgi:protein SFI1
MNLWWSSRREWKLVIKADCHLRYQLWKKAWDEWRKFSSWCRMSTAMKRKAQHHAIGKLMRWTLRSWICYWKMRQCKRSLYHSAAEVFIRALSL